MSGQEKEPVVSIILPTYKRADRIGKSIESILHQEEAPSYEILIMDDGSTDNTAQLIENLSDGRIRYYRLEHRGACAARNEGIRKAAGKYIAFQDSDDIWHPQKLSRQIKELEENAADIVFNAYMFHNEAIGYEGRFPEATVPEGRIETSQLLIKNLMSTQMVLGKSECFKTVLFNENYRRFQDWEIAIRLSKKYKMYYFSEILADVYMEKDSISAKPELALKTLGQLLWDHMDEFAKSREAIDELIKKNTYFSVQKGEDNYTEKEREIRRLTENVIHLGEDNKVLFEKCESLDKLYRESRKESQNRIRELTEQISAKNDEIEEIHRSTSWKLTEPIRRCRAVLSQIRQRRH